MPRPQTALVTEAELVATLRRLDLFTPRVSAALELARTAHAGATRRDAPLLEQHIYPVTRDVATHLAQNQPAEAETGTIVALLHDIIEEADAVTPEMLAERFGQGVADAVALLTKPSKVGAAASDSRTDAAYAAAIADGPYVVKIVKVFDRINNLTTAYRRREPDRRRYLDETRRHYLPLAAQVDLGVATRMGDLLQKVDAASIEQERPGPP